MNEIIEAFRTRISSPLFGYAIIAFIIVNWKPLFYLFAGEVTTLERFEYFDENTTPNSLLVLPILFAIIGTIIYPWINYMFLCICIQPTDLRNSIQAQSQHNLLIRKKNLEAVHNEIQKDKENEIIRRTKIDDRISLIPNKEIRKLSEQLIMEERLERERKKGEYSKQHSEAFLKIFPEKRITKEEYSEAFLKIFPEKRINK